MTSDPRAAAVERAHLDLLSEAARLAAFGTDAHDDVGTFHHPTAFPLFNSIFDARFAAGPDDAVRDRADEVLEPFQARGLPFLWWTTPATTSACLDAHLRERGLAADAAPGMYVELTEPLARTVPGLRIEVIDVAERPRYVDALVAGFGMPTEIAPAIGDLFGSMDPTRWFDLLGSVDGEPVAGGSVWISGATAGLFNIFTREDLRGRGYGAALTAALMDRALRLGCREAVLSSSEPGFPVYRRLGFETVCEIGQYVGGVGAD